MCSDSSHSFHIFHSSIFYLSHSVFCFITRPPAVTKGLKSSAPDFFGNVLPPSTRWTVRKHRTSEDWTWHEIKVTWTSSSFPLSSWCTLLQKVKHTGQSKELLRPKWEALMICDFDVALKLQYKCSWKVNKKQDTLENTFLRLLHLPFWAFSHIFVAL